MRGVLVFNDNQELVYLSADKDLRARLAVSQCQLAGQTTSTETFDATTRRETTTSTSTSEEQQQQEELDKALIAYTFLPLLMTYKMAKTMNFDRYLSIRNRSLCFQMAETCQLLVIAVGGRDSASETRSFLEHFLSAYDFAFGPLAYAASHPDMIEQLRLLSACLNAQLDSGFLAQTQLRCVNVAGLTSTSASTSSNLAEASTTSPQNPTGTLTATSTSTSTPSSSSSSSSLSSSLEADGGDGDWRTSPSLRWLADQFRAFVNASLCILVRNGTLLALIPTTSTSAATFDAKAWHLLNLLATVEKDKETPATGQYAYSACVRLSSGASAGGWLSDVYRTELNEDGSRIVCVSPMTNCELMADLVRILDLIDSLDRVHFRLFSVRRSDSSTVASMTVTTTLDGRRFYEELLSQLYVRLSRMRASLDAGCLELDRRLLSGVENARKKIGFWSSSDKRPRPDVTHVDDVASDGASTLKLLRRQISAVLLQVFRGSAAEARGHKREKLERCWQNLRQSSVYQSTTGQLNRTLAPSERWRPSVRAPGAGAFSLNAKAYVFVLPERRQTLFNGLEQTGDWRRFYPSFRRVLDVCRQRSSCKIFGGQPFPYLCVMVASSAADRPTDGHRRTGLFSSIFSFGRAPSSATGRTLTDDESMAILCLYDPFVNRELAYAETRQLMEHLRRMTASLKWTFF